MEILFLGTASGVPTRKRNVSAAAVIDARCGRWFLVDCGEATQHQLLKTRLSLRDLSGILITHVHGDHCYGLPGLLSSAAMSGRSEALTLIAPEGIEPWVRATLQYTQAFLPFALNFVSTENLQATRLENFEIEAFPLAHRVPSYAYRFTDRFIETKLDTEALRQIGIAPGPLWSKIRSGSPIEHDGKVYAAADFLLPPGRARCVIVAGDNERPDLLRDACAGCDVLVHESTYSHEVAKRKAETYGHSDAVRIASFASDVRLPNLVLTHFSARYGDDPQLSPSICEIRREAEQCYQGRLFLAEDFARYRLDGNGLLSQIGSVG